MTELYVQVKPFGVKAFDNLRHLSSAFNFTLHHGYEADALLADIGKAGLEYANSIIEFRSPERKLITAETELRYALIRCYMEGKKDAIEAVLGQALADIDTVEERT